MKEVIKKMKKYIIVLFLVSFLLIGVVISAIIVVFYPKVETWEGRTEREMQRDTGWLFYVKGQDGDHFLFKFYCDPPFDFYVVLLSSGQHGLDFDVYDYNSYTNYWHFTDESGGEAWYNMDFPFYDTWTILVINFDVISSYISFEYYSTYKETSLDFLVLLTFIPIYIFLGCLGYMSVVIIITGKNIFKKRHKKRNIRETIKKQKEIYKIQKLYCPECGTEILDETKMFCPMCGKEQ